MKPVKPRRIEFVDWIVVREPETEEAAWWSAALCLADDREEHLLLELEGIDLLDEARFKVYRLVGEE